ncbi:endosomal/lysosomal proton channel TMEM175-like [Styela clava]|uniref:endosomal/lysosomal potassium channel TMEM175-like n=1 Tax=Styela clava TaxID=7725 RepID=UPI0019393CE6|nr:endosomal/lysosomal potassium channel TMEM175-like [Styela clava]
MADNEPSDRNQPEEDEDDGIDIEFQTVRAMRLKMFSDAVWSIVATIMIVPTMHLGITEELHKTTKDMQEIVKEIIPQVFLYLLAFLIICSTWNCHVWTFQTMKNVTDLSIVFNLILLLAASFLPYFYSMMSRFQTWQTIVIYSSIQIFIGLIQCALVLHAFSYPGILRPAIDDLPHDEKMRIRRKILYKIAVAPAYCAIAMALSAASTTAAMVCLALILIHPWTQSLLCVTATQASKCAEMMDRNVRRLERDILLTERVKKERIEAFSDGVFAITSTLLVLDISEKYLPSKKLMKTSFENNPVNYFAVHWGVYVSYVQMFIIIGLLWYTQLMLFKNFERFSRVMLFANNLILACIGMIPLSFTFILHFKIQPAIRVGLQFACITIFLVGLFSIVLYVFGFIFDRCKRKKSVNLYVNQPNAGRTRPDELVEIDEAALLLGSEHHETEDVAEGKQHRTKGKNEEVWMSKTIQPGGKDFWMMIYQMLGICIGSSIVFGFTFMTDVFVSMYVGTGVLGLYTLILVLWKSIAANVADIRSYYEKLHSSNVTGNTENK